MEIQPTIGTINLNRGGTNMSKQPNITALLHATVGNMTKIASFSCGGLNKTHRDPLIAPTLSPKQPGSNDS